MTYTRLKVERRGPVGWLIFDRPDAGNAMDATMFDELERAWSELDGDPDVRVIVNTGEGRAFQTGVDVVQMATDKNALREHSRRTRDATLRFTAWHCSVWKPVIAAVNGTCAGGGLHFVADADIVIAASDATFVDPHVSLGQVVAYEGIALARKSPMEPILRMALVGRHERVTAERARQLGILSEVVDPPERLRDRAGAGGDHRQELARRDGSHQARTLGCARDRPHRRVPRGRAGARRHVGPSRPRRRPARLHREARRELGTHREDGMSYQHLIVERHGPVGWLVNNRPDQLNAMNALDARRVRRCVARARPRPGRPGDRAHRRRARVPDRRGRGRDRERRRRHAAVPGVGGELRLPLHRVAPARVEAGDHRGQRHLLRRRVPLGGRRRHRHRRVRRAVLRPPRVDRAGRRDRGDRADSQDAGGVGDAHGVHGSVRADGRGTRLRARDDQRDRRPTRAAARACPGARRDDRQELAGGDGGHEEGALGRARDGAERRVPCRWAGAGQHVGPPRSGGRPARVHREARRQLGPARRRPLGKRDDACLAAARSARRVRARRHRRRRGRRPSHPRRPRARGA